jgi:hypothetical protein
MHPAAPDYTLTPQREAALTGRREDAAPFQAAWQELVGQLDPPLHCYICRMLAHHGRRDSNLADDIDQLVWKARHGPVSLLAAFRRSHADTFFQFLARRARRKVRAELARDAHREEGEASQGRDEAAASHPTGPELFALVKDTVRPLPPALEEVARYYLLGEGDLSGLRPAALRQRLCQLKKRLQGQLGR